MRKNVIIALVALFAVVGMAIGGAGAVTVDESNSSYTGQVDGEDTAIQSVKLLDNGNLSVANNVDTIEVEQEFNLSDVDHNGEVNVTVVADHDTLLGISEFGTTDGAADNTTAYKIKNVPDNDTVTVSYEVEVNNGETSNLTTGETFEEALTVETDYNTSEEWTDGNTTSYGIEYESAEGGGLPTGTVLGLDNPFTNWFGDDIANFLLYGIIIGTIVLAGAAIYALRTTDIGSSEERGAGYAMISLGPIVGFVSQNFLIIAGVAVVLLGVVVYWVYGRDPSVEQQGTTIIE